MRLTPSQAATVARLIKKYPDESVTLVSESGSRNVIVTFRTAEFVVGARGGVKS